MAFDREQLIRHVGWQMHRASGCKCSEDMVPTEFLRYAELAMGIIEPRARADERTLMRKAAGAVVADPAVLREDDRKADLRRSS